MRSEPAFVATHRFSRELPPPEISPLEGTRPARPHRLRKTPDLRRGGRRVKQRAPERVDLASFIGCPAAEGHPPRRALGEKENGVGDSLETGPARPHPIPQAARAPCRPSSLLVPEIGASTSVMPLLGAALGLRPERGSHRDRRCSRRRGPFPPVRRGRDESGMLRGVCRTPPRSHSGFSQIRAGPPPGNPRPIARQSGPPLRGPGSYPVTPCPRRDEPPRKPRADQSEPENRPRSPVMQPSAFDKPPKLREEVGEIDLRHPRSPAARAPSSAAVIAPIGTLRRPTRAGPARRPSRGEILGRELAWHLPTGTPSPPSAQDVPRKTMTSLRHKNPGNSLPVHFSGEPRPAARRNREHGRPWPATSPSQRFARNVAVQDHVVHELSIGLAGPETGPRLKDPVRDHVENAAGEPSPMSLWLSASRHERQRPAAGARPAPRPRHGRIRHRTQPRSAKPGRSARPVSGSEVVRSTTKMALREYPRPPARRE